MPADADTVVADLRSDTVTRPTAAMREAMAQAVVGDDVLGDDPTVNRLQDEMAALLGKEAGCFVPSGTMANGTAIRALTEPGDEILSHLHCHYYEYESGCFAALSGCAPRFLDGPRGQYDVDELRAAVRPRNDHFAHAKLLIIENTSNRGGGSVWPLEKVQRVSECGRELGLNIHLDGARLWNACIATDHQFRDYAQYADTVSMCFSKGMGAPVGSIVVGDQQTIDRVRRFRKMFGGTMRQSGVLAAAALFALQNHYERLADDHVNARHFAKHLNEMPNLSIDPDTVETNILYVDVDPAWGTGQQLADRLEERGVRMFATGPQRLRGVVHLDVPRENIDRAIPIVHQVVSA